MQKQGFIRENEVFFSDDDSKVYINIKKSIKGMKKEDFISGLATLGVCSGIINQNIDKMINDDNVGETVLLAESQLPVDGKDGWFEFLFETNVNTKPKVLRDGSVDYSEYGDVPSVEEGQKLAIYHQATDCKDGVSFRGETLVAKKGNNLAKLKGKGFYISEDGNEYFAKMSGRAVYKDDRLLVENELVIDGDVSNTTGDVTFSNDIHIRGNVLTGTKIVSAKGNIIVDGYVEACEIQAGGDVILKNGMQGNGKGKIISGGSVSGKFFEQTTVNAKGDVQANAIMNSKITATQDVIVSGKFGIIIGGEISAERYINATIIGNMSEVKTRLSVGVDENLVTKLSLLDKKQTEVEENLKKVSDGIVQIGILIEKSGREDLNKRKVQLIRAKVELETQINECIKDKQEVMNQMTRANLAKITVQKVIYPGTVLSINGVKAIISEETNHVEITAKGSVIEIK